MALSSTSSGVMTTLPLPVTLTVISLHSTTGGKLSTTVTLNIQVFILPARSVTLKATITLVPISAQQNFTSGPGVRSVGSPHTLVIRQIAVDRIPQVSIMGKSSESA